MNLSDTPDPVVDAYKKDVDRTLLRENLKRTVQERFERRCAQVWSGGDNLAPLSEGGKETHR